MTLPSVSVIIVAYNEERRIDACLASVVRQNYPDDKLEIVFVDDASTDRTVEIARKYTARIYTSGKRILDISKAIGFLKAKGELVMLLDADNILPDPGYLKRTVRPFLEHKDLTGSYPCRFAYSSSDHPSNRYCSLLGLNDPFQYYTGAREHLTYAEDIPPFSGIIRDKGEYFLAEFDGSQKLTLGAIGFIGKRKLLAGQIRNGYFFHSDACNALIARGYNMYGLVKETIIHNHSNSHAEFFRKLERNFRNYLKLRSSRTDVWAGGRSFFRALLLMITVVHPLTVSLKGYRRFKDPAWFLHPVYSFAVVVMYSFLYVQNKAFGCTQQ